MLSQLYIHLFALKCITPRFVGWFQCTSYLDVLLRQFVWCYGSGPLLLLRQELPGCHFLPPAAAFSRLNRTQCRRPTDRARYQCCPHRSTLHCYSFCFVQCIVEWRHHEEGCFSTVESLQCAVEQWFCGRVGGCCYIEDCAGATQRGPSPGPHRTRGGSSIYFLFCPAHQPWIRKNTRKLCPRPSIMKRKTSMEPTQPT